LPPLEAPPRAADHPGAEDAPPELMALIEERLAFYIADYRAKRNQSRRWTTALKVTTILLAAGITIISGFAASKMLAAWAEYAGLMTLVLGVTLTALGAWEAFVDHRWKWIRYRVTLAGLYTLEDELRFRHASGQALGAAEAASLFQRLQHIVHETNQEWMSQRGQTLRGGPAAEAQKG
jgi:hypothetical protein